MAKENIVYPFGQSEARSRQELVDDLKNILDGVNDLRAFPANFKLAIRDRVWADRRQLAGGTMVQPITFREFIHERYPIGLGIDYATVERLISDHTEAKLAYDAVVAREPGGQEGNKNAVKAETNVDNMHIRFSEPPTPGRPTGTSEAAGLRRLRKAAEDGDSRAQQHLEEVLAGKTSVHAACLAMGWRKPTVTLRDEPVALFEAAVRKSTPLETAKRAWLKMSPDEREEFLGWTSGT